MTGFISPKTSIEAQAVEQFHKAILRGDRLLRPQAVHRLNYLPYLIAASVVFIVTAGIMFALLNTRPRRAESRLDQEAAADAQSDAIPPQSPEATPRIMVPVEEPVLEVQPDGGRVRKLFIGGYEAALRGRTSGILLAGISSSEPRIVKLIFYRPPLEKTSDKLTKPYENESYSRDRKSSSPVRNPFGMVNGLVFMVCGLICLSLWGREAIYFLGRRWGWPAAIVLFVFGFAFTVQGGLILGNSLPD